MRPDDTFVTPSAVRLAGKPTSLPTDDTVWRPRYWTLERRARSAFDGSGLIAWTQCRTYGPEPPSNLRDTTRTGSRTRRSGHVPQPDSADTTLPPYRRGRSVFQQSGPARRCPRHRDRPPGRTANASPACPGTNKASFVRPMTVLLRRCPASFHRPEGRLRSTWPRFGWTTGWPSSPGFVPLRSVGLRLDFRGFAPPHPPDPKIGWPWLRSTPAVRPVGRPPLAGIRFPRPARGPSDVCGRYRGDKLAYRGLSYMGIRASIRQVLPRRLEPILS